MRHSFENSFDAERRLAHNCVRLSRLRKPVENSFDAERRLAPFGVFGQLLHHRVENSFDAERRLALEAENSESEKTHTLKIPLMPKGV